jgi:hypothetical protein
VRRPVLVGLALAEVLMATAPPPPLAAQTTPVPVAHRKPRRVVFAVLGGILGAVGTWAVVKGSKSGQSGGCTIACSAAIGGAIGATAGFFIGKEFDKNYAAQFSRAVQLNIKNKEYPIEGEPSALAVRDSNLAVASSDGVAMFAIGEELLPMLRRAKGLRGITAVDLAPSSRWLAIGSPSGLYEFPPDRGPGSLVREGTVAAASSTPSRVYFAVNDRIEIAPFGADTTRAWPGVTLTAPARTIRLESSRGILWAATDRDLLAFRIAGDSLIAVSTTPIEAAPQRLAVAGSHLAVAQGAAGVRLFDIADPATPKLMTTYTTPRFAYDVAIDSTRMFVAAGPDGVYVAEFSGPGLRTLGLARSLGFATAIESLGGYTYILDRRTNSVRRIESMF